MPVAHVLVCVELNKISDLSWTVSSKYPRPTVGNAQEWSATVLSNNDTNLYSQRSNVKIERSYIMDVLNLKIGKKTHIISSLSCLFVKLTIATCIMAYILSFFCTHARLYYIEHPKLEETSSATSDKLFRLSI